MTDTLMVSETWTDATDPERPFIVGDSGVYESIAETPGEPFRLARRAWGRCTGRVYVDGPDGTAIPVGWIFQQRAPYEDAPDQTWIRETWITVHAAPTTVTRTPHYLRTDTGAPVEVEA
jgi:hypothetical protein